ncbi:transmembrane protein [Legionella brunensis]|uniref:Transmembrane protein n=1 Tax=Legionella brunensis TaxID=29422 RepID=A0A0W0S3V9_9GAMM|nr:transmembrane protein [Legionella brunensis]
MLGWTFVFFAIAGISAIFAFRKPAFTTTYIAKLVFYISLALFIIWLFATIMNSAPPPPRDSVLPI